MKDYTGKKPGRPATHTDSEILDAIEAGSITPAALLSALGMHSQSTLMIRLRRMRDAGLVDITERARCLGFTIRSNRTGVTR